MQLKRIEDNVTELKVSNKKNEFLIKQLEFIGAVPVAKTKLNTHFRFNGSFEDCKKYLGL